MTIPDYTTLARQGFRHLLDGKPPNGITPEQVGPWGEAYQGLITAYHQGGTAQVVTTFNAFARVNRDIALLVASDPQPQPPPLCPPLPDTLAMAISDLTPCATWLDDYIAFAQQAAPMTPRSFHEAAGLFAGSLAIARRLVAPSGVEGHGTFPNLFLLELAPPAIYKKTTGLNVLLTLINHAGLSHLLLPQDATPQGLILEMSTKITPDIANASQSERNIWLRERAFAAQRGWILDEAASLFASFSQKFNANLDLLIIKLANCQSPINGVTAGRGRITIDRTYLSVYGASAPETMRDHVNNLYLWGTGLWSRFAFIIPDTLPVYHPRPGKCSIPTHLVTGLRTLYHLFPIPEARWEKDEETERTWIEVSESGPPHEAHFTQEARILLETYEHTVGFEMLRQQQIEPLLYSAYDRLAAHAYKVSMILAAFDATQYPIMIEARHVRRALRIVETWRVGLHTVWSKEAATNEIKITSQVLEYLQRNPTGASRRELCQQLHAKAEYIQIALDLLADTDLVESFVSGKKTVWRSSQGLSYESQV